MPLLAGRQSTLLRRCGFCLRQSSLQRRSIMQGLKQSTLSSFVRLKVLGRGSFGYVYLAKSINNKIGSHNLGYVALKVTSIQDSYSLFTEKFVLQHFVGCPEIVQCIGCVMTAEEEDSHYTISYNLILEYAAGGTLADLIKRQKKLHEDEAKEYLRMMLRGLSCIHSKGFVHGDLKPANILAFPRKDGKIYLKIADFGISQRFDEMKGRSRPKIGGTLRYLSPEAFARCDVNPSLDIWSLGCILIDMISGKRPWDDCKNRIQLRSKLVLRTEVPKVPQELSQEGKDFLRKCFDLDFTRRWTANMLLQHPYLSS